jgi:hypothetical protein
MQAPSELIGRWVSTVKPPRGEAPAIWPSVTVEAKDGKVLVSLGSDRGMYEGAVFTASSTQHLAVVRIPAAGKEPARTVILRPTAVDQVNIELFQEYFGSATGTNFYYAELFKRAR